MKTAISLILLSTLVSCGKHIHESDKGSLKDLERRVKILETRLQILDDAQTTSYQIERMLRIDLDALNLALESVSRKVWSDDQTQALNDEIASIKATIEGLKGKEMSIETICNTSEMMVRTNDGLYAVISSIANNGNKYASNVHLGKIVDGSYQLTDGSNVTFQVTNGKVKNCSNE